MYLFFVTFFFIILSYINVSMCDTFESTGVPHSPTSNSAHIMRLMCARSEKYIQKFEKESCINYL